MENREIIPGFDCVAMKRLGAARVYGTLKDLDAQERLAYWRRRNEELEEKISTWKSEADSEKVRS